MAIMVSLPGAGNQPEPSTSPGDVPLGVAVAAQAHLPEAARNAFWQANMFEHWTPAMPIPAPPGPALLSFVMGGLPSNAAAALAAGLDDPNFLERLVRFRPEGPIIAQAAKNPYLATTTLERIAGMNDGAVLVDARLAARRTLDAYLAGTSTDPGVRPDGNDAEHAARVLIDSREGLLVAELIAAHADSTADTSSASVAEAAENLLVNAPWGSTGTTAQLIRGVVINRLANTQPTWVARFGAKIATNRSTPIDPGALPAVEAALAAGVLTADEITATLDEPAAVVAELHGGPLAELLAAPATPRVVRARRIGREPDIRTGTRKEADVLALLGLASVGARMSLTSSAELTDDEIAESLETADVETILDWAENRLPHRPAPGQVGRQIDAMPYERAKELAVEAERRPDVLAGNPELALALPGAAARFVPPRAARAVRSHMQRTLGDHAGAWKIAATLLTDPTNDLNVLGLTEAAALTGGIEPTYLGL